MLVKLTKEQLLALKPCRAEKYLPLFDNRDTLTVHDALAAKVKVWDLLWVASRLGLHTEFEEYGRRERAAIGTPDEFVAGALIELFGTEEGAS